MTDERETIERRRQEMTTGPNEPAFETVEEAAQEARAQAEQQPGWTQGEDIPAETVPQSERLQRPVATETDSY